MQLNTQTDQAVMHIGKLFWLWWTDDSITLQTKLDCITPAGQAARHACNFDGGANKHEVWMNVCVHAYYIYVCRPSVPSLTIHANCKPEVLSCQRFECAMCVKRSVCCVCVWWLHSAHQVCRQVWACLCVCSRPRMMSCLSDTPGLHFCAWGATACHCHRDAQGGRRDRKRGEGKGKLDKLL